MLTKWTKILCIAFFLLYALGKSFSDYWIMDMLVQYSLYTLGFAFIFLIIYTIAARKQQNKNILFLVALFALPYLMYRDVNNFYFGTNQHGEESNFKIVSINIYSGNANAQPLEDYLTKENPDLIVLQELTPAWQAKLDFLRKNYPYYKEEVRSNNFGIGAYSKTPFTQITTKNYIDDMHPSLLAEMTVNGKALALVMTHPVPPLMGQERFEKRNKQYRLLKKEIDELRFENIILIGDLNSTVFSPNFKLVQSDKMKDARSGFGLQNTWNAFYPIFRTNIDQCWVSKSMGVTNFYTGDAIQSDHLPIVAELQIN